MATVLFSYSHHDSHLVMRIYNDLKRAGFNVWRYEVDGRKGNDYHRYYLNKLKHEVSVFCFCDSSNARKSKLVKDECQQALQCLEDANSPLQAIKVCLLEEKGKWHNTTGWFKTYGPFNQLNNYDYFKLYSKDVYDEDESYREGIIRLIDRLGGTYNAWGQIPRAEDFENELNEVSMAYLSIDQKDILKAGYNYILATQRMPLAPIVEKCKILLHDCEQFNTKLIQANKRYKYPFSIYLTVARNALERHDYKGAYKYYLLTTHHFPTDPRGHAGFGNVLFVMGENTMAAYAFETALKLMLESDLRQDLERQPEVYFNLFQTYIQLNEIEKAEQVYNTGLIRFFADEEDKDPGGIPEAAVARFDLLVAKNQKEAALSWFNTGLCHYFENRKHLSLALRRLLASRERRFLQLEIDLKCYPKNEADRMTFRYKRFSRLVDYLPESLRYRVELAMVYIDGGDWPKVTDLKNQVIRGVPLHREDFYYQGAMFYFLGKDEKAAHSFEKSNKFLPPYTQIEDFAICRKHCKNKRL